MSPSPGPARDRTAADSRPPRVSVVLPVRNGRKYVAAAIESMVGQTFDDFELLVLDDGSTDSTARIVRRFAAADDRLRLVQLPPSGQPKAMNHGVALARGDLIARMDADDISHPGRLAKQVRFLDEHPEVVALGTAFQVIDAKGRPILVPASPSEPEAVRAMLQRLVCAICHPSVVFRRQLFLRAGGYRAFFAPAEDFDLWLRMSELGELANLPEVLLDYRVHPAALSTQRSREQVFSTVAALRIWREALELQRDSTGTGGPHSRAALRGLGVPESEIDAAELGMLTWQIPLMAQVGNPRQSLKLLRASCAEMTSENSILRAQSKAASDLLSERQARLAVAAIQLPAGCLLDSKLSERLQRLREAVRAEAKRPLRAVYVPFGSNAGRSASRFLARLISPFARRSPGTGPVPAAGGIGFFEQVQVLEGSPHVVLHGWGNLDGKKAGYRIEISSPCALTILKAVRTARVDLADGVGEDLLFSGFEITAEFHSDRPPQAEELALDVVGADGSRARLPLFAPTGKSPEAGTCDSAGGPTTRDTLGDLRRLSERAPPRLGQFDIACYMIVRNEVELLASALDHQRRIGVCHFFVIDNGSSDGSAEMLLGEADVTVYRAESSFGSSNFGMDWAAILLDEYSRGRWALVLDADEAFVYPHCESLPLCDLARFLSRAPYDAASALCIDMYSENPVAEAIPNKGTPLLERFPYFDRKGYFFLDARWESLPVRGGPRARLFWSSYLKLRDRRLAAALRSWDEDGYLFENPDVAELLTPSGPFASGLEHFLSRGRFESRVIRLEPHPSWDEEEYRGQNPDVDQAVTAGTLPSGLDHFLRHGQFEDRSPYPAPPLLGLSPLLRWREGLRFRNARHGLESDREIRSAPIQAAVLHFKLLSRLASRAAIEVERKEHWDEASDYRHYAEALRREPRLSAFGDLSVKYEGSRQLLDLGLMKSCDALDRFAAQRLMPNPLDLPASSSAGP